MRKYDYISIGGENSFSSEELIGKDILSVIKDGVGCSKIVTGTPVDNEAQYLNYIGQIGFASAMDEGIEVLVLYQDKANVCFTPLIQEDFALPDANAGFPYNSSFYISGSKDFTLSSIVKPAWMTIPPPDNLVTFTGTPQIADVGSVEVKFTISNACGSVDFDQSFTVRQLAAEFGTKTFISGDRTNELEQVAIIGTPGVVVTITLTTLTNPNGGTLKVNDVVAAQGDTYNINAGAIMKVEINGNDVPGTAIIGFFTIASVSAGEIGLSNTYQISKAF